MKRLAAWLVPAILATACASPSPDSTNTAAPDNTRLPQTNGTALAIGAVTPDRLSVDHGRVGTQTLTVAYSIPDPDRVTNAELKLYIGEIGDIATQKVGPAAYGSAQFVIEPTQHALGALVRFRASCPNGTTDWYTLGQIPYDFNERMTKVFRIGSVTPQSVPWTLGMNDNQRGAGQHVTIWGPELPSGCRIEAEANGSPVELNNVVYVNKQYEGLLMYRDIGYSPVAPRFAELKLVVASGGQRVEVVKRVAFIEQ